MIQHRNRAARDIGIHAGSGWSRRFFPQTARPCGSARRRSAGRTARCACCAARLPQRNCEEYQSEAIGSHLLPKVAVPNPRSSRRLSSGRYMFSAGRRTRFNREAGSSTFSRSSRPAEPHVANVSRSPLRCRYLRGGFPDSGSSSLVEHFQDATKWAISDRLCVLEGGTI